jgi:diaminobutyrate-2-oxoglutarate transaminase
MTLIAGRPSHPRRERQAQSRVPARCRVLDAASIGEPGERRSILSGWTALTRDVGLGFEGRDYPTVPIPVVLTAAAAEEVATGCERLHAVLERGVEWYRRSARIRRTFFADYASVEADLLADVPYRPFVQLCRFDGGWTGADGLRVVEANTACPGGIVQSGLLTRVWLTSDLRDRVMGAVSTRETPLVGDPLLFGRALVDCAASMGIAARSAAVVNLRGVYRNEVDHIVGQLRALGLDAAERDLTELAPAGGRLRPDLVYHKLDPLALLADGRLGGYRRAFAQPRSCLISSLPAQLIAEDKAMLAVLTDPEHSPWLTDAERDLVTRHVPWTRLCRPGVTSLPDGARGPLLDYAVDDRPNLVLKPTNLTRGAGVVHGALVDADRWRTALADAARGRYVLQRRVVHPTTWVPGPDGQARRVHWGLDVYVLAGRAVGFHARASTQPTINIGQDGVALPVVVADAV